MELQFTEGSLLFMSLAMLLGFLVKRNPKLQSLISVKAIPLLTVVIQFCQQVLLQAGVADAAVIGVTIPIAIGGFFGSFLQTALMIFIQTVIPVGTHSAVKNSVQLGR